MRILAVAHEARSISEDVVFRFFFFQLGMQQFFLTHERCGKFNPRVLVVLDLACDVFFRDRVYNQRNLIGASCLNGDFNHILTVLTRLNRKHSGNLRSRRISR